jgi:hypothetical protein
MGCGASTTQQNVSAAAHTTTSQPSPTQYTSVQRFTWAYKQVLLAQQQRLDAAGRARKVWKREYRSGLKDKHPGFPAGGLAASLPKKDQSSTTAKPSSEMPMWIDATTPQKLAGKSGKGLSSPSGLCEGHPISLKEAYAKKFQDMPPRFCRMFEIVRGVSSEQFPRADETAVGPSRQAASPGSWSSLEHKVYNVYNV